MSRVTSRPSWRGARFAAISSALFSLIATMAIGPAAPASAVNGTTVCALTSGGSGVYRYNGASWTRIGDAAGHLYGGRFGLFATTPDGREIVRYLNSPFNWQGIGGSGATWAVTNDAIYRLSPDLSGVWKWTGTGLNWTQVGGPANWLYGGGLGLFATTPDRSAIYNYRGTPWDWQGLGQAAPQDITYVVGGSNIYGLGGDHHLWVWNPNLAGWVRPQNQPLSPITWLVGDGGGIAPATLDDHGNLFTTSGEPLTGQPFPIGNSNIDVVRTSNDSAVYAASPLRDSVWKRSIAGWSKIGDLQTQQLVSCP
ncbi:hypothetical protein J5X84_08220 [Streptosporangiaceae bacterium NEAU-GS5]|nr:hypothetical protein [Streptosporangiaceae bacterium NEAU-GS5]